jgi:hypothetical protein
MSGRFMISALVGLALAAIGCGDDGADLTQFVGTWKYSTSMARFSCPGQTDQTGPLASMKHWGEGVKSNLVDLSTDCNYRFDVKNKVAAIQLPQQTCMFDDGSGAQAVEAPNSWLFTLLSPTTAEEKVETVTTFIDGVACTLTAASTLDKISKD